MTSDFQEQLNLFGETKRPAENIVAVQFQNKFTPGRYDGMEYTYYTKVELNVGEVVIAPTKKGSRSARVCRIGIDASEISEKILSVMLTITQPAVGYQAANEDEGQIEGAMLVRLDIKKPSEFFWLAKIRGVDISQCCKKCFHGESESRLYHETSYGKTPKRIELNVMPHTKYAAYYLCGLSKGFNYRLNTHLAFIHAPGETLHYETSQVDVEITNARRVEFEHYVPNPLGYFTDSQRKCRNWIFANFLKDGQVEQIRQEAGL